MYHIHLATKDYPVLTSPSYQTYEEGKRQIDLLWSKMEKRLPILFTDKDGDVILISQKQMQKTRVVLCKVME